MLDGVRESLLPLPILAVIWFLGLCSCGSGAGGALGDAAYSGSCPAALAATIDQPLADSSPIVTVKVGPPCIDHAVVRDGGGVSPSDPSLFVVSLGQTVITKPTTCGVSVYLADGAAFEGSVTFHPLQGACSRFATTDTPQIVLVPFDGGVSAGQ
jgi:hypothetical protein